MRQRNTIDCIRFTPDSFIARVGLLAGLAPLAEPNDQTRYLAHYLGALGAVSLVVESHYVDRHYMDEYAGYYSRCLHPPPSHAARIHAFACLVDDDVVAAWVSSARAGSPAGHREAQAHYLGSVVVRPIAWLPIGRTILRPIGDAGLRLPCLRTYKSHLLGIELSVKALAFQQADGAAGACATTAVWSALSRVCHVDGFRAPTPMAITQAAVRNVLFFGRPFPSQGLTAEQIYEALRSFEFGPDVLLSEQAPWLAALLLRVYLDSGVPAVLALDFSGRDGHAVTAVGYRPASAASRLTSLGHELDLGPNASHLIIHDNRLGPYLEAGLVVAADRLALRIKHPTGLVEMAPISQAIYPLYGKLRMTANQLVTLACSFAPELSGYCGLAGAAPAIGARFERSGSYLATVGSRAVSEHRAEAFLRGACLSRYIGLVEYSVNGEPLADAIWDTTDPTGPIDEPGRSLLGLVARSAHYAEAIDDLATDLQAISG